MHHKHRLNLACVKNGIFQKKNNTTITYIPGVMQLLSNLASDGRVSPLSNAFFSNFSASLADLFATHCEDQTGTNYRNTSTSWQEIAISQLINEYLNRLPRCWFIFALGATPSTAIKNAFLGLISRNSTCIKQKRHLFIRQALGRF